MILEKEKKKSFPQPQMLLTVHLLASCSPVNLAYTHRVGAALVFAEFLAKHKRLQLQTRAEPSAENLLGLR